MTRSPHTARLRAAAARLGRAAAAVLALSAVPAEARAQLALARTLEGPYGYVTTGATLRTASNTTDPCVTDNTASATLSGIPAGATVVAAYLYWAGSYDPAGAPDLAIRLNDVAVTVLRSGTDSYTQGASTFTFFGAVSDVTSRVTGNGTYTVSRLGVWEGAPHCGSQAVMGGWSLFVVYSHASQPLRRLQLRDGFRVLRQETETVSLGGFMSSPSPDARMTYLVWEGDDNLTGTTAAPEALRFNGTAMTDALNPANNAFNSTINAAGNGGEYGLDLDTFNGSALLAAGARSATLEVVAGNDLVVLQAVMTSLAIVTVDVTPKGLAAPVQRLPGTRYAQLFQVENTSIASGPYDLVARATGTPAAPLVIDSVTGPGITTRVRPDSARVTLAAGTTTPYTVWYTVPVGASADGVERLLARSVTYPTRAEARSEGWAEMRRVAPALTLAKTVSPQSTLAPGTELTYTMAFGNVGGYAAVGVVVSDSVPPQTVFKPGSPGAVLPAGVTATVQYSADGGATWSYVPVSGGCGAPAGYDGCVRRLRWLLAGSLAASGSPGSSGTVSFVARIR